MNQQSLFRASSDFASVVPIRFHLIYRPGTLQSKSVPDAVLTEQVRILNADYAGTGVSFRLKDRKDFEHPDWHEVRYNSKESRAVMTALNHQPRSTLNIYVCRINMLGWASFPWDAEAFPEIDGIFLARKSLPLIGVPPYNLGKTLTHEIGHWCGLYHTFEGGCGGVGDEVDDTPNEARAATGSLERLIGRDTCPDSPGPDPIRNYMNYTDDAGMSEFTPGQIERMRRLMTAYRSGFSSSGVEI